MNGMVGKPGPLGLVCLDLRTVQDGPDVREADGTQGSRGAWVGFRLGRVPLRLSVLRHAFTWGALRGRSSVTG